MTSKLRRGVLVAVSLIVIALASACEPNMFPTSTPPCYAGNFTANTQKLVAPLRTSIGDETIWLVPGGHVELSMTDGNWTLAVDEQLVARGNFTGQAYLNATASGTLTATDATLNFSLSSLNGSGHVLGYEQGRGVKKDVQLPGSYLDNIVGLQGQASYTCTDAGLSLAFDSLHIDFTAAAVVER
ncbi:MAG TPA: hypothetical protein VFV00_07930 [Acidimicrobiales bacterium]|nr:hypothetical protein [Acidimicrobiales bacterium]